MVARGFLAGGDRLPPERVLADKLNVSRNRVSTAYKELENENLIFSRQGKGTFINGISGSIQNKKKSRKDKLLEIIDLALEETMELGFSLDDFLSISYIKVKERRENLQKYKVALVECSQEQISFLLDKIEFKKQISRIPVLTTEMWDKPSRVRKIFEKVEIIITTSFHLEEVSDFMGGREEKIINLSLEPRLETIVELARIKTGAGVGLVCNSPGFAREVRESLDNIDLLNNFKLEIMSGEKMTNREFLNKNDILLTSPHKYKEVKMFAGKDKKIIKFEFTPDQGSINMLKTALMNLKAV